MKTKIGKDLAWIFDMKIYTLLFTVVSIWFFSLFFSYTLAQEKQSCESNPPVCSATPQTMNLYLEFQSEAAGFLKTNKFETATEAVNQGEWGIFSNKLLEIKALERFDESLAGQALKLFYVTSARSATALITSAFVFELSALSTLADSSVGLTILFHDRPIVRDWAKLLEIERNLNQSAYHLGKVWEITKTLTKAEQLRSLLKNYEKKGLFQDTESFPSSITYTDLISNLVRLNLAVKAFLAYGSVQSLEQRKFWWSTITFSPVWIEKIKSEYQCVRWNAGFKCNPSWSRALQDFQSLLKSTENQGEKSWSQISQSWKNLVQALGTFPQGFSANLKGKSSDAYLTEREKILLRDIYGLDTTKMTKDEALSIISLSKTTKNQRKETSKSLGTIWKKTRTSVTDTIKDYKNTVSDAIQSRANQLKKLSKENESSSPSVREKAEIFEQELAEKLLLLSTAKAQADALSDSSNNIALTQQFGVLSVITKKLLDTIGTKEKNLRKTLNAVCVYQCSNKGTSTCYVQ